MNPGTGKIMVRSGAISQSVAVEVVNQLAKLEISPNPAIVNPGSTQAFSAKGYDAFGNEIILSPNVLSWSVEGNIGTISSSGELQAVNEMAAGKVVASYGSTRTEVEVNVGKAPVMIEDFEDISDLYSSSARANSVKLELMSRSNPVRFGTHSAKLSYDFTGTIGTSAAYVNFRDAAGALGRELDGRPAKLGIWVYGDGKNHWLRGVIQDGNGKNIPLNFTGAGELNWIGWKYLSVDIPADTPTPIKLRQVYVVETSNSNKNSGAVYFDNLRAVYTDTGEDLTGPVFGSFSPGADRKAYTNTPEISAIVKDEGKGVDAGSIKMTIDGNVVAHTYDPSTGKVSYTPSMPLADGVHKVEIDCVDIAGNPALPKADWKFTVYTGPDMDAPQVQIISPHDGITTRTNQPRIAVKLSDEYSGIDSLKTILEVDGQVVEHKWDGSSSTVFFTPASAWESRTQHQVKVTAYDRNGNAASQAWSFTVGAPLGQPNDANRFQMSIIGDGGYYTAGQGQTAADILLREQIARINQEPSELVGYTGDIVENDTPANYATAIQNLNLFKAPYVVSIGNHEISGTSSRENYQKTFGETTYLYDYGNTRIIGLDSASGTISASDASQWPWLQDVLEKTQNNNILIFMHVPPDEISADGEDFNTGHGFRNPVEAQRFYDLLGNYKAAHPEKNIVVLSGDLHAYHHKTVQGVEYVISGGGGKYTHIPPEKGGFYHYLNLKVDGSKVTWEVIPLLESISFPNPAETVEVSEQAKLNASGKFMTSTNDPITLPIGKPFQAEWTSNNPSVAKVDETGTVTAVAPGEAEITVKSGWREAQVTVKVPPSPAIDAVARAEELGRGSLDTQELIDAAKAAAEEAEKLVGSLREGEVKAGLLNRLNSVKVRIEQAQTELNLKVAKEAVASAEAEKTQENVNQAQAAIDKLPDGPEKSGLQKRLDIVKAIIKANSLLGRILNATTSDAATIDQAISGYYEAQAIFADLPDGQDKSALHNKLDQAEKTIVELIKANLAEKSKEKPSGIHEEWLDFLVKFAIKDLAAVDSKDIGRVQGYVMSIVNHHATGHEVRQTIEKYLK
jgi:hypothetical protein